MKSTLLVVFLACFAVFVSSCSEAAEGQASKGAGYLDSVFVDGSYRQTLENLSNDGSIPKADRESIRSFVRKYRKRIPEGWTYGRILQASNGIQKARTEMMTAEVSAFMRKEEDILNQFFTELTFKNNGDVPVEAVFGDLLFKDASGKLIHTSPTFLVQGPIQPGASTKLLRLQYAYERPTGNALNDPKNAAMRDTLNMLKDFSKAFDPSKITLRVHDILLDGGVSVEDYYLLEGEARAKAAFPSQKKVALNDWVKKNQDLIAALASRDPSKILSVRPVLTDGYEAQHGNYLMFDRRKKVVRFFTQQHKISGRNIDPSLHPGKLESRHLVDFWGWPMELWIFAVQR